MAYVCSSSFKISLLPSPLSGDAPVPPLACAPANQRAVVPRVRLILHPFTPYGSFWHTIVSSVIADDGPGFILHAVTRFHWPEPHRYYGLICHLTPTAVLGFPLISCFQKKKLWIRCQASPVTTPAPCKVSHPQTLCAADRVLGFALFCMLTPTHSRIRFAYAMYTLPPMASFRPHRWPVTPLPFGLSSPRSG